MQFLKLSFLWYRTVSEWLLLNTNSAIFQLYFGENKLIFNETDDEVCFFLDQYADLEFYSASSLKQQSLGRHFAPLRHIILIPSQPVFSLSPWCCVLSREATHINLIVFGLTWPGLEPTIYRTRGEHTNHYATDAVWYRTNPLIVHQMNLKVRLVVFFHYQSK